MRGVMQALWAFILLLATGSASAQFDSAGLGWVGISDSPTAPAILYVNGIRNSSTQAATASQALRDLLVAEGLPAFKYKHYYFWNPTEWAKIPAIGGSIPLFGAISDTAEVRAQGAISANVGPVDNGYQKRLGGRYTALLADLQNLDANTRRIVQVTNKLKQEIEGILESSQFIVIVPHSQGNLYVEAAYAMLVAESKAELIKRIRVVGVASAASSTPNGVYITHNLDYVIQGLLSALKLPFWNELKGFNPLEANVDSCRRVLSIPYCDVTGHGFESTYLNDAVYDPLSGQTFPAIVNKYVRASLAELEVSNPTYAEREWMRVEKTMGIYSWNQIASVCDAITGKCSGIIGSLDVSGWTWASTAEVFAMFEAASGLPTGSLADWDEHPISSTPYASNVVKALGCTFCGEVSSTIQGFSRTTSNIAGETRVHQPYVIDNNTLASWDPKDHFQWSGLGVQKTWNSPMAIYLYRASKPSPTEEILFPEGPLPGEAANGAAVNADTLALSSGKTAFATNLGIDLAPGHVAYVRIDYANAKIAAIESGITASGSRNINDVTVSGYIQNIKSGVSRSFGANGANRLLVQGGSVGDNWAIYQIQGGATGHSAADTISYSPPALLIKTNATAPTVKYRVYSTAVGAQNESTQTMAYCSSGQILGRASLTLTKCPTP